MESEVTGSTLHSRRGSSPLPLWPLAAESSCREVWSFANWGLTLDSDHREICTSLWLTDSACTGHRLWRRMYRVCVQPGTRSTAGEGCSAGTWSCRCHGSPNTRFPVIALSFLVFRSLPQGLLKVPQWGLGCVTEHDKIPLVPAELPQLGLARTQPQVQKASPSSRRQVAVNSGFSLGLGIACFAIEFWFAKGWGGHRDSVYSVNSFSTL